VIDFETGSARSSVNIPLQGVPLRQLLTDRVGIPAFVDNDATVAALAEAHDDDLNLIAQSLVMITVGTGVGGGIVIDGRIYRGVTGAAPELGHILVAADLTDGAPPRAERQPHHASLEYMAAGRALDRLGEEHGLGNGTAVVAAAREGDPEARECMRILGERLGVGIANVVNIFDPELVVIGGGVSVAGELLLDPAKESASRFIISGVGTQTRIELARYGPKAGVRGAALLAGQELEREALPLQETKES
jgi:glucokinase